MPVRVRKARLQAASRPLQREAEVRAAEGSAGAAVEDSVRLILRHIGEDPEREGLKLTPTRVLHALEFLTRGYSEDPKVAINGAVFSEEEYQEIILCKDLDFYSLCEHHLLPFFGKAHVAYLPNRRIIGLSKLARLVEIYARRLQVQERLTTQIANTLMEELEPLGVAVVLEAEHLCMRMRGVEKQNCYVTTSAMLGVFRTHFETRQEFMNLLRNGKQ
jgi:GTP cyclohydrolase IA